MRKSVETAYQGLLGQQKSIHARLEQTKKEVLDLQRATRFVPTKADNYKGIEAAGRNAGLLK